MFHPTGHHCTHHISRIYLERLLQQTSCSSNPLLYQTAFCTVACGINASMNLTGAQTGLGTFLRNKPEMKAYSIVVHSCSVTLYTQREGKSSHLAKRSFKKEASLKHISPPVLGLLRYARRSAPPVGPPGQRQAFCLAFGVAWGSTSRPASCDSGSEQQAVIA